MTTETTNETTNETPNVTRRLDDIEFITICERVAKSDNPCKEEIAKQAGVSVAEVTKRRSEINRVYAGQFKLTGLPRGGKKKVKDISAVVAQLAALGLVSTKLETPPEAPEAPEAPENETDSVAGDEVNDSADELYEDVDETETVVV
jgi:hypothetical protein